MVTKAQARKNLKKAAKNYKDIMTNKINLDVFKAQQSEIDKAQIEFNNATLDLIKDIYKTLIIGFLLLIILMLVTWGYLTYTYFNH
jgi:vacuolar-type H+-ATPase subunit E/Vma4